MNNKDYAILFVDDENKSVHYFNKLFIKEFNILTATHADEAWDIVKQKHAQIAVVVSDQRMPQISGVNLLTRIKNTYPNIIRIITTAYIDLSDNIAAINESNVFAYLIKPWDTDQVRTKLYNALAEFKTRLAMIAMGGSIAHEVRNPLNAISGFNAAISMHLPEFNNSQASQDGYFISKDKLANIHMALAKSDKTIQTASHLINAMLFSIRNETVDTSCFTEFSIKSVINYALEHFGYQDDKERALIQTYIEDDFHLIADKTLLVYVLFNLIKNALHYKKIKDFHIEIRAKSQMHSNLILIRDYGVGIAEDQIEHIFHDFYTSNKKGGTGLGLPFCKRIMEAFKGEISCTSILGSWTEFCLAFPKLDKKILTSINTQLQDNASLSQQAVNPTVGLTLAEMQIALNNKKLLIVDDDENNRFTIATFLMGASCQLHEASNGQEALEAIKQFHYDAILTDLHMPEIDGYDLSRSIRNEPTYHLNQSAPIIVITGKSREEDKTKILQAGATAILIKPFNKQELISALFANLAKVAK